MQERWLNTLGQMQCLAPDSVDVYANESMGVFIPKVHIDYSEIEHIHRGYEFVVFFGPSTPYKVEHRTLTPEGNKLFPFNPEQSHRAIYGGISGDLLALFFEAGFLEKIARSIYGVSALGFKNVSAHYDSQLQNLLRTFIEESRQQQGGHDFITQSIAIQAAVHLLRNLDSNCSLPLAEKRYSAKKGINRAIDFIHENYDKNFSLNELAQIAYLSPYYFLRVFKAEIGKTPFEYLLDVKIEKAKESLRLSDKPIIEICYESGFNNASHFARSFSKKVGVTPSVYRMHFSN